MTLLKYGCLKLFMAEILFDGSYINICWKIIALVEALKIKILAHVHTQYMHGNVQSQIIGPVKMGSLLRSRKLIISMYSHYVVGQCDCCYKNEGTIKLVIFTVTLFLQLALNCEYSRTCVII